MTSCETSRRRAYADDLRWRMVWQREVLGYTYQEVATNLCVDVATVWRMVKLFEQTGGVSKSIYPRERSFRKMTPAVELTVLHIAVDQPGIYLREI